MVPKPRGSERASERERERLRVPELARSPEHGGGSSCGAADSELESTEPHSANQQDEATTMADGLETAPMANLLCRRQILFGTTTRSSTTQSDYYYE